MKLKDMYLWAILRISMGFIFLWAFLDKTFGLGFSTAKENAWINGVSPTTGFLLNATRGPFAEIFRSLAGQVWVDWALMIGFLFIGLSMIFGISVKVAGYSGALMMLLFFVAGFLPPEHNPLIDEHVIYALVFVILANSKSGHYLGLGKKWCNIKLVKKYPILR